MKSCPTESHVMGSAGRSRHRRNPLLLLLLVFCAAFAFPMEKAQAFWGVGDTVNDPIHTLVSNMKWLWDEACKVKDWASFMVLLGDTSATVKNTLDTVHNGLEMIRLIGDPVALMGKLGLGDLASAIGDVQQIVGKGAAIYREGMDLFQFGQGLAQAVQSGNYVGAAGMLGLGEWAQLGTLNTPQGVLGYINQKDFRGYSNLNKMHNSLDAQGQQITQAKERLTKQIQSAVSELDGAPDQATADRIKAKITSLEHQAAQLGDSELANYLHALVMGNAFNMSQDARTRAMASAEANQWLENHGLELDMQAARIQAVQAFNSPQGVGEAIKGVDPLNPANDTQGAGGTPSPYNNASSASSGGVYDDAAAQARVDSLSSSSTGWCARGVNNTLQTLTDQPLTLTSGANAKDMGPVLQNNFGMYVIPDTGSYQNGDTRILPPVDTSQNGHIETYVNGVWSSDFKQNNSLNSLAGSARYITSQATLYRLPGT